MNYLTSILLIIIFPITIINKTFSQVDSIARNQIYLEVAGVCGYGSINYERIMYSKKYLMFATRCGISTYHIKDYTNRFNPDILIPLAINGYYGKSHKIELGVGEIFSNIVHAGENDFKPKRITKLHTILSIGYRYQKNKGGMVLRCTYTPIIEFNNYLRHWAGISFGYSF